MIEHRLIERMVALMRQELERIRANIAVDPEFAFVDPVFIDTAVDFLRIYADRCHHGKEEDILFAELTNKDLAPDLKRIMVEDHVRARQYTGELVKAKENYLRQEPDAVNQILSYLDRLTAMYPKHINTEDQHFFIPCMEYFSAEEKDAMLEKMWEFDRKMIHERYEGVVGQSPEESSRLTEKPTVTRSGGSSSFTQATSRAKVRAQASVWSWPVMRWASSWQRVARRRPEEKRTIVPSRWSASAIRSFLGSRKSKGPSTTGRDSLVVNSGGGYPKAWQIRRFHRVISSQGRDSRSRRS